MHAQILQSWACTGLPPGKLLHRSGVEVSRFRSQQYVAVVSVAREFARRALTYPTSYPTSSVFRFLRRGPYLLFFSTPPSPGSCVQTLGDMNLCCLSFISRGVCRAHLQFSCRWVHVIQVLEDLLRTCTEVQKKEKKITLPVTCSHAR